MVGTLGHFAPFGAVPAFGVVPYGKGDGGWQEKVTAQNRAVETRIAFLQEHEKFFIGAAIAGGVLIAALLAFSGGKRVTT